ncbi:MAG: hypothetical protein K6G07_08400, partial [Lachnospiraceae bacterium]|nr:hypothetical protein [Lachnospiraceae bacterium]
MIVLIIMTIIAALAAYKLLPVFAGAKPSMDFFTDFIVEHMSESGLDKEGELTLFWFIVLIGVLVLLIAYSVNRLVIRAHSRIKSDSTDHVDHASAQTTSQPLLTKPKQKFSVFSDTPLSTTLESSVIAGKQAETVKINNTGFILFAILGSCFLAGLIAFGRCSLPLLIGAVFALIFQFTARENAGKYLILLCLSYYDIVAGFTFATKFAVLLKVQSLFLQIAAVVLFLCLLLVLYIAKRRNFTKFTLDNLINLMQLPLPLLLFIYTVDTYYYNGTFLTVPYAWGYRIFFYVLISLSFLFLVIHRMSHNAENAKSLLSKVTPIIIFVYHSFSACPMYAQPDQHHHGEQMIPWNQVFEHGQHLYDTYFPASGLFPYVSGFVQHVVLNGTVTDYSPAISITMVCFCVLTMYLICKHIGAEWALLLATLTFLPSYNRQYFILPALLLLTLPKLMENKMRWLKVWIFTCFIAGLYYPLFGAAILIGTLPIAVKFMIVYFKTDVTKIDSKGPFGLLSWIIVLIPILISLPLLFGMLKHTLLYSSQTTQADGISILSSAVPSYFLPYLADEGIRSFAYYGLRFILPAFGIWLGICIGLRFKSLLYALLTPLCLAVGYTYTLVRADVDKILSRTGFLLMAVFSFLAVFLIERMRTHNERGLFVWLLPCFMLPFLLYPQVSYMKTPDMWVYPNGNEDLAFSDGSLIYGYYDVPDNFLQARDTGLLTKYQDYLGNGFMVEDQIHYIKEYCEVTEKVLAVKPDATFLSFDGQGFFDYLNVTCYGTGYLPVARSYEAQMEIWESDPDRLPVVLYLETEKSYYIFREMVAAGYIYDADDHAFYPPDIYPLLTDTSADGMNAYIQDAPDLNLGGSPASFAESYKSLRPILAPVATEDGIDGSVCEVMLLSFPDTLLKGNSFDPQFANIA